MFLLNIVENLIPYRLSANLSLVDEQDIAFLDLKKAFDAVDHEIFIRKLQAYGIEGTEVELFRS